MPGLVGLRVEQASAYGAEKKGCVAAKKSNPTQSEDEKTTDKAKGVGKSAFSPFKKDAKVKPKKEKVVQVESKHLPDEEELVAKFGENVDLMSKELAIVIQKAILDFLEHIESGNRLDSLSIDNLRVNWHAAVGLFTHRMIFSTPLELQGIANVYCRELFLTYKFLRVWCGKAELDDGSEAHLDIDMIDSLYEAAKEGNLSNIFNRLSNDETIGAISQELEMRDSILRGIIDTFFPAYLEKATSSINNGKVRKVQKLTDTKKPSLQVSALKIKGLSQKQLRYLLTNFCSYQTLNRYVLSTCKNCRQSPAQVMNLFYLTSN